MKIRVAELAPVELADRADAHMDAGQIVGGLELLVAGLSEARQSLEPEDWRRVCAQLRTEHRITAKLHQDPMTWRAFTKPRGYAGDAVMMDYLYGIHGGAEADRQASPIGRAILRHIQTRPTSQGVVFRRRHLADLIDRQAAGSGKPSVLAIAAGHLREVELSTAVARGAVQRLVALDADADSLAEVGTCYGHLGIETHHGSVREILRRKVRLGQFDLVYAAGLYDYLVDEVAQALTARMIEMTKPGGTVLIPNFAPSIEGRGYMECFMDWQLIYRDEYDMVGLLGRTDRALIDDYDVYADPWGSVVYLRVRKAG